MQVHVEKSADLNSLNPHSWTPEGKLLFNFTEHTSAVNQLLLSPDGKFFLSCSDDGTIRVWDTGKIIKHVSNRSRLVYTQQRNSVVCYSDL